MYNMPYEKIGNNEPVSIADEVPFEIPESWEWVRLGTLFEHNTGKALNQTNKEGVLLDYITTSNLYWNRFELESVKQMYFKESEIDKCTATKGDLLICEGGDIGRAAIWNYDYDIRIQNHIHKLRAYVEVCTEYYYYLFFLYKGAGWIGGKGIGIQGLSANALHNILFPLPPIAEQYRIVDKIKELKPYTDKYTVSNEKLNNLNNRFPELLKKSILQEAVMGKLVTQDENDEPASVLLERIREEKQRLIAEGKLKKDNHESIIYRRDNSYYEKLGNEERCIDDEIPFDIPDSWEWTRLSTVLSVFGGKRIPAGKKLVDENTGHKYIRVTDMKNGTVLNTQTKYVTDEIYEQIKKYTISKNDVYITVAGTIGQIGLIPDEFHNANLTENADKIIVYFNDKEFIYYLLSSPLVQNQIQNAITQVGQPKLAITRIQQFLITIPPINEQVEIVQAIKKLLPYINNL